MGGNTLVNLEILVNGVQFVDHWLRGERFTGRCVEFDGVCHGEEIVVPDGEKLKICRPNSLQK